MKQGLIYMYYAVFIFIFTFLTVISPVVSAGGNLNVSGMVKDVRGTWLDGAEFVTFRLYETETEGEPVWEETLDVLFVDGGYFVELGSMEPIPSEVFEEEDLYLTLQIGDDTEMAPRMRFYSVPWAMTADIAMKAKSLDEKAELTRLVVGGYGEVINSEGEWVGSPTGLKGDKGDTGTGLKGDKGDTGATGSQGPPGTTDAGGILTGTLADTRLSSNVSLLGPSIESNEMTDGTILDGDISSNAAIAGTKINPDFGTANIATEGNIAGDGTITAGGDLAATGGFKMMIGPFQEKDVGANTQKGWDMMEDLGPDEIPMPWAGSVMGVSARCKPATGVTAGTLTIEPTINGQETNLEATLNSSQGSNKGGTASQAKDTDTFAVGVTIGCKGTTSADYTPTTLDCVCLVFVEM